MCVYIYCNPPLCNTTRKPFLYIQSQFKTASVSPSTLAKKTSPIELRIIGWKSTGRQQNKAQGRKGPFPVAIVQTACVFGRDLETSRSPATTAKKGLAASQHVFAAALSRCFATAAAIRRRHRPGGSRRCCPLLSPARRQLLPLPLLVVTSPAPVGAIAGGGACGRQRPTNRAPEERRKTTASSQVRRDDDWCFLFLYNKGSSNQGQPWCPRQLLHFQSLDL
jgi:hypothetical protein